MLWYLKSHRLFYGVFLFLNPILEACKSWDWIKVIVQMWLTKSKSWQITKVQIASIGLQIALWSLAWAQSCEDGIKIPIWRKNQLGFKATISCHSKKHKVVCKQVQIQSKKTGMWSMWAKQGLERRDKYHDFQNTSSNLQNKQLSFKNVRYMISSFYWYI